MGFGIGGLAVYFGALMLTHVAAFRTAKNMRAALLSICRACRWGSSRRVPPESCVAS